MERAQKTKFAARSSAGARFFLNQSSILIGLLFLFSAIAVIVSSIFYKSYEKKLQTALNRYAMAESEYAVAQQKVQKVLELKKISEIVKSHVNGKPNWIDRNIAANSIRVSREEANRILFDLKRKENSLFGGDFFDLSVTQPSESLFKSPSKQSKQGDDLINKNKENLHSIHLSLKGRLYFSSNKIDGL